MSALLLPQRHLTVFCGCGAHQFAEVPGEGIGVAVAHLIRNLMDFQLCGGEQLSCSFYPLIVYILCDAHIELLLEHGNQPLGNRTDCLGNHGYIEVFIIQILLNVDAGIIHLLKGGRGSVGDGIQLEKDKFHIGIEFRKGFQIGGGATGSFGGRELLDVVLDYGPLRSAGLSLGTAAIRFIAQEESVPHLACKSISFLKDQSCGLCTACRYGLSDLTNELSLLCGGQGAPNTLAEIKSLCGYIGQTARCALGQAAPTALLTAMKAFPAEFEDLCGKEEPYGQYSL